MANAESKPKTGVWADPQRGLGPKPLIKRSGGSKLPEAENILDFRSANAS